MNALKTKCNLSGDLDVCCDTCQRLETKALGLVEPNESYHDDENDVFLFHVKRKCTCGQDQEINIEVWVTEDGEIVYHDDTSYGCEISSTKKNVSATQNMER
jgi:hypothetical protein